MEEKEMNENPRRDSDMVDENGVRTVREDYNTKSTKWKDKDFYGIVCDLQIIVAHGMVEGLGVFNPIKDLFEFRIHPSRAKFLDKVNEHDHTVRQFCQKVWPRIKIVEDTISQYKLIYGESICSLSYVGRDGGYGQFHNFWTGI